MITNLIAIRYFSAIYYLSLKFVTNIFDKKKAHIIVITTEPSLFGIDNI